MNRGIHKKFQSQSILSGILAIVPFIPLGEEGEGDSPEKWVGVLDCTFRV